MRCVDTQTFSIELLFLHDSLAGAILPHSEAEVFLVSNASDGAGASGRAGVSWVGGGGSPLSNVEGRLSIDPIDGKKHWRT